MTRCRSLPRVVSCVSLLALLCAPASAQEEAAQTNGDPYDVVLRGGRVMDPESGLNAIRNVGIRDGTIAVLSAESLHGEVVLDAEGLVVAPGFIDLDTYARLARFQVTDGVTTMFDIRNGTAEVDAWYAEHHGKMPIHYGVGVGFREVRHQVMEPTEPYTTDVPAGDDELAEILRGIGHGLRRGAVAIGMGPGRHTALYRETLETFRLAAGLGSVVVAPLRDAIWHETDVPANLAELIGTAALTGASAHIPYLSSSGGPHVPRLLELIDMARERGLDITAEDYPYRGSVNRLDGNLDYLRAASDEELSDVFLAPANRTMKREDIERYRDQEATIVFLNSWIEPYVQQSISSPLTSIASHGFLDGQLRGHPRTSGTYSRVLGRYVREQGRLTLMEALRKMTLMPAQRLEDRVPAMKKKGRVQVGADADLVAFDPNRVIDRATFQEPTLSSEGMRYVLVNGLVVVRDGVVQDGVLPGRPVRAPVSELSSNHGVELPLDN
jgi:hypothetical protein